MMVGGNGPEVTWRLAARFADELNLDALTPAAVAGGAPGDRRRCEEIGRDPARCRCRCTYGARRGMSAGGTAPAAPLQEYADLGVERVIVQGFAAVTDPDILESTAEDCAAVGLLVTPSA